MFVSLGGDERERKSELERFHFEIVLTANRVGIGRVNEEGAIILQDSKIAYRRKTIPEGQGAGCAAGQLDFAASSECSASKLKCYRGGVGVARGECKTVALTDNRL